MVNWLCDELPFGSGIGNEVTVPVVILLHEKFLQFDWLRAVVFQLNLKYLHVKITNLAGSSINK